MMEIPQMEHSQNKKIKKNKKYKNSNFKKKRY